VLILGCSKLVDLGTGLNSHLLLSSKHWRIEFITNVFLVLMAGLLNYLLVRRYGIIGSAWATLIAFSVYNTVRFLLIWKLFKMQPFTWANALAIVIAAAAYLICRLVPAMPNIYLDVVVRTLLFSLGYGLPVLGFRLSEDINGFVNRLLRRRVAR
ncbi:MAG TPA: polysaccharide biosynthesis C-terminal domain-containing protein, partial [Chitinophagaceae bacterium]|nr:polysaccharide biosynthesis C-terminal domain-containing protein [Chitinophagaceae bacterium]